jgi:carboxyl-terminal processing protease
MHDALIFLHRTDTTMRRKVLPAGGVLFSLLGVLLPPLVSRAAPTSSAAPAGVVRIESEESSPEAAAPTTQVGELLRRGRQLEIESRWGEALSHYENAVRRFPEEQSLHRRFDFTRLHYDLGRRYSDPSFCEFLSRLTLAESLDLYDEVLLKIEAHYVEAANWKELLERGTNSLEVALSAPAFRRDQMPDVDAEAIDRFRYQLRRQLGYRLIQSRGDVKDAVLQAARLAEDRLALKPCAVVLEYLCGATNGLDPYSAYLTRSQLTDVESQIEGNFVGLGIELKAEGGALVIVRVIAGSPAENGGILGGDRILAVDGQSTEALTTDQAANVLQGVAGSTVTLKLLTPGQEARDVTVRRERVDVPSVDDIRIVDEGQGIGYLKLTCFQKTTPRDLDAALWQLHRQGMKSLVVDVRGNPGGLLITAVDIADKFLERGIIVSTRGRNIEEDQTYTAHEIGTWPVPLVVLIDEDSASAAEIFAGAIHDHHRGTVMGTRSYGKGSVQGIFKLNQGGVGVRLTTAKFFSPTGRAYSHVGVEPDVVVDVHRSARPVDGSVAPLPGESDADPLMAAAVQAARQLMASR